VLRRFAAGHFQIHAGIHRGDGAIGAAPVRNDEALEAPLFLKHILQQERVFGTVHAIDLVVGGHHRPYAGFLNRRLEGGEIDLVQGALANDGIDAMPFELLIIGVEVLDGGDHALALNSLDVSDRQAPGEVRVFAEALEISAP